MFNVDIRPAVSGASSAQQMRPGSFFGAMQGRREQCGAIFTDLRHTAPRKLPTHSHEFAFFARRITGMTPAAFCSVILHPT